MRQVLTIKAEALLLQSGKLVPCISLVPFIYKTLDENRIGFINNTAEFKMNWVITIGCEQLIIVPSETHYLNGNEFQGYTPSFTHTGFDYDCKRIIETLELTPNQYTLKGIIHEA